MDQLLFDIKHFNWKYVHKNVKKKPKLTHARTAEFSCVHTKPFKFVDSLAREFT